MRNLKAVLVSVFLTALLPAAVLSEVTLEFVVVTNEGNAAQGPSNRSHSDGGGDGRGAVAYSYSISKYMITVAQYAEFLNAVAKSDPYDLYNRQYLYKIAETGRDYGTLIERSGENNNYSYSVAPNAGNLPIPGVSWFDAARFANWMHNGQGNGSTETGVYDLVALSNYTNNAGKIANYKTTAIVKSDNARFWIPTENEWYKAAYYDPAKNSGAGGYWLYATRSDTITNVIGKPNGVNYRPNFLDSTKKINSLDNNLTPVGAFGDTAKSYYGTCDQSGNLMEWTDGVISVNRNAPGGNIGGLISSHRVIRGGAWMGPEELLRSSFSMGGSTPYRLIDGSKHTLLDLGFRLASTPYGGWSASIAWNSADPDPSADPDNDGLTNEQEFIAGTDPLDSSSTLCFEPETTVKTESQKLELVWASKPGKVYALQATTTLDEPFQTLSNNIVATPPQNRLEIDVGSDLQLQRFFRITINAQ